MRTAPLMALLLIGCMAGPRPVAGPARIDPRFAEVVAMAADQVKRCYRTPRVPHAGRQIVTTLGVHYAPDGTLAGLPEVRAQRNVTPETQLYAAAMAEAASLAVEQCSPLRLPQEYYKGGWDDFELTFSPGAIA
jgi:hypothetical protein